MEGNIKRIGVLTGGGDAPGLNAVIRAVTKTAITQYGWEVLGIQDGFEGLLEPGRTRPLDFDAVRGILPRGGTILGTTNRANPFNYSLGKDGRTPSQDMSDTVIRHANELGIDCVLVLGGDGTMNIAHEISLKGLRVVGVPKTIDNDILLTDITFGFDTAANTAMEALDRLHTTAESHHRVMILEVMGRDAGWIALRAGIAGGADVILIPEIPFEVEEIANKIDTREKRGAKFSIIVVAEGAKPVDGSRIYLDDAPASGARRLGGIGEQLAETLRDYTHKEVRVTVLGHLQRGGSPTAYDRLLASRFGAMAVHAAARKEYDHMVALQGQDIVTVPLEKVVVGQKLVTLDSDLIETALGLVACLGQSHENIVKMREAAAS
jgi:ATP-dependent phosphofructokinase / diphosphate-dependent phosphofructokinase